MAWVIGIGIGLFLLFAFPRQFGALLGIVALGIGALLLYFWSQSEQAKRDEANLVTSAHFDPLTCPDPAFPISVAFTNRTGKTVEYISFLLEAYRPGYSSAAYSNYQSWDRIMTPGQTYSACWSLASYKSESVDKLAVTWRATVSSIRFQ